MQPLNYTPEQQAIIRAVSSSGASVMVSADAGAAKTSTMVAAAKAMPPIPALAIAFNKKTAEELKERFPAYWQVKTMNGLGYSAWQKKLGVKLTLNDRKGWDVIKELARGEGMDLTEEDRIAAKRLVDAARHAGLVHEEWAKVYEGFVPDSFESWQELHEEAELPKELYWLARAALRESTKRAFAGQVDFDDMIYCSVMLGGVYSQYPMVAVDEAQDLNSMNHLQVRRSLQPQGRLLVVGDPKQSIYLFRGTHRESMEQLRALRASWLDLTLKTTFRCPKLVVARQQDHAPGYTASPGNPDGEVYNWRERDDQGIIHFGAAAGVGWNYGWVKSLRRPGDKIYIICRNNAPIMGLAFKLLRQRIIPEVLGKEIGKGLIALTRKLAPKDETTLASLGVQLDEWESDERLKAEMKDRRELIPMIEDKAESLRDLMESARATTAGELRRDIEMIFNTQRGEVTLGSIHKIKGLEAEIVLHLDPWRIPSRYATERAMLTGDESELLQERNLKYVAETRTKRVLIEADVRDFVEG